MSDTAHDTASVIDRAHPVAAGAPVVAVRFIGEQAVFVLGEEALLFASKNDQRRVTVHGGAILSVAGDATRIVTGGDDGQIVATDIAGESAVIAADAKRRWIDHVALGPDGAVAWSAGKQAFVKLRKGEDRSQEFPSSVGGLAFAPKGFRLAVAHYGGARPWVSHAPAPTAAVGWERTTRDADFLPGRGFFVHAPPGAEVARG